MLNGHSLFHVFYPDARCASAYDIPYERLYRQGYRCVLYDIDNTLVPHNAPADARAAELFARLHAIGFRTALVSNNAEKRVRPFADSVHTAYVCHAGKPARRGYQAILEAIGADAPHTFFVGDQIFTDIWGAKRAGIKTVLVRQIDRREEPQIVLKRIPERLILFLYRGYRKKHGGSWTEAERQC